MGNSWWKHGSLNCDRTWELGSDAKKIAEEREKSILDKKEPEPIVCPQCAKVRQTGKICPSCGYESEKKKRMVMQVDGSLVPYHGDIFKPRVVKMKDDTEKHWESIYYRAKKSKKSMSWKQAYGLFYHEHGYWPPKDMGLMPKSEFQWERRVCETPYADLNQSDRI